MNCLSDEVIQMFIDGEVPDEELIRLQAHISDCQFCAERIREQRELSQHVIASINNLVGELHEIPGFTAPHRKRFPRKKFLYGLVYPLAAACVVMFFLYFSLNKNYERGIDIFVLGGIESEIDGNLPISEQEVTFTVIESSAATNPEFEN